MGSAETAAGPAIVAESASKLFLDGAVVAFHQLSLDGASATRSCASSGPRGCGKTTLLRCIAGLTDLSSGQLLVHGKPVAGRPPDGVAMVFQHFGLLPWKTVYDNAAFGLAMAGAPAARSRSASAHYLELVGLDGLREALSLSTLRRHAAARRPRARARHQPVDPADGRAVRRARRADPRNPAGRAARAHGAAGRAQDHGVHHPFDRRGDPARRPHRGDERASRPHQGSARHAVRLVRATSMRCAPIRASPNCARTSGTSCTPQSRAKRRRRGRSRDHGRTSPTRPASALRQRASTDDKARAERVAAERRQRRTLLNLSIRIASLAIVLRSGRSAAPQIDPVLFTTPSQGRGRRRST